MKATRLRGKMVGGYYMAACRKCGQVDQAGVQQKASKIGNWIFAGMAVGCKRCDVLGQMKTSIRAAIKAWNWTQRNWE